MKQNEQKQKNQKIHNLFRLRRFKLKQCKFFFSSSASASFYFNVFQFQFYKTKRLCLMQQSLYSCTYSSSMPLRSLEIFNGFRFFCFFISFFFCQFEDFGFIFMCPLSLFCCYGQTTTTNWKNIQKLIPVACFANSISKPLPSMLSAKRVWHICLLSCLSWEQSKRGRQRAACFIQLSIWCAWIDWQAILFTKKQKTTIFP